MGEVVGVVRNAVGEGVVRSDVRVYALEVFLKGTALYDGRVVGRGHCVSRAAVTPVVVFDGSGGSLEVVSAK